MSRTPGGSLGQWLQPDGPPTSMAGFGSRISGTRLRSEGVLPLPAAEGLRARGGQKGGGRGQEEPSKLLAMLRWMKLHAWASPAGGVDKKCRMPLTGRDGRSRGSKRIPNGQWASHPLCPPYTWIPASAGMTRSEGAAGCCRGFGGVPQFPYVPPRLGAGGWQAVLTDLVCAIRATHRTL